MSRNPDLARTVNQVSWGLLDTAAELILFSLSLGAASFTVSGRNSVSAGKALHNASKIHSELIGKLKPSQLKGALENLRRKGLIGTIKGKTNEAKVTKIGLQHIQNTLPVYKPHRPWDKRIYLIDYDIAESDRVIRDKLRNYQQIKCAPLHKSVYLSIYSPKGLLKTWAKDYTYKGNILVSDLGPDGTLGDQPLSELVIKTFKLEKINEQYRQFLHNSSSNLVQDAFQYYAILDRDPQLPFELLPNWWLGDKAWKKYRKIISK